MDSSRILLQINHISVVCGRLIWFFRRFLLKKESGFVQNLAVNQSHLSSLCSLWWCRLILGQSRFRSGGRPWWSPRSTSCLSIPLASQTQCRPHASHSRSSCCTIQPLFFAVLCWCISAHSHQVARHTIESAQYCSCIRPHCSHMVPGPIVSDWLWFWFSEVDLPTPHHPLVDRVRSFPDKIVARG